MPKVSCKTKKCLNWKDGSAIIKDTVQPWWVLSSTVRVGGETPTPIPHGAGLGPPQLAVLRSIPITFYFWGRVSLCSPGCPGTHDVDRTSLKPQRSTRLYFCLCFCGVRIQGMSHHTWIINAFLEIKNMQSLLLASNPSDNRVFGLYLKDTQLIKLFRWTAGYSSWKQERNTASLLSANMLAAAVG